LVTIFIDIVLARESRPTCVRTKAAGEWPVSDCL